MLGFHLINVCVVEVYLGYNNMDRKNKSINLKYFVGYVLYMLIVLYGYYGGVDESMSSQNKQDMLLLWIGAVGFYPILQKIIDFLKFIIFNK